MPSRDPGVSVDTLREAARLRAEDTSLRLAASEMGISHQALHAFIRGSEPYGPNLAKLREWYGRETNEAVRLRQEVEDLKRKLAECEKQLRKK